MSRCNKRDKDLGQCLLADGHTSGHHFEPHLVHVEPEKCGLPTRDGPCAGPKDHPPSYGHSTDPWPHGERNDLYEKSIRPAILQALNSLSDAVHAMNPARDDLAVMATNQGIMVFYDKSKGFPLLPHTTAHARDK